MGGRQLSPIANGSRRYSLERGQIDLVQRGETPSDFRPMPDVGLGAMEIRVHGEKEFRVFYVARFEEAVYVLHCFVKKTRSTRKSDIDLARRRYAAMLELRRSK